MVECYRLPAAGCRLRSGLVRRSLDSHKKSRHQWSLRKSVQRCHTGMGRRQVRPPIAPPYRWAGDLPCFAGYPESEGFPSVAGRACCWLLAPRTSRGSTSRADTDKRTCCVRSAGWTR